MFKARRAKKEFLSFADTRVGNLSVSEGMSLFLDFYQNVRASDTLPVEESGDMLLFQWGAYDWGKGLNFEVNLTRQFILPDGDEDDDIWQLMLTYDFGNDESLVSIAAGHKWCESPNDLPAFRDFILNSDTFSAASKRKHNRVELNWEHI